MHGLANDIRYVVRTLWKSPGFMFAAILTLALGIGANTCIFTAVNAYLIRPLPFPQPDRLVLVPYIKEQSRQITRRPIYADYAAWRHESRELTPITAFRSEGFNLTGSEGPERVRGIRTTAPLFELFGVQPVAGRLFLNRDDERGAAQVALIGEGLWQRRFGGRKEILGQPIQLNASTYTLVGVVPASLKLPERDADVWVPLVEQPQESGRDTRSVRVIGRLAPGRSLEAAASELSAIVQRTGSDTAAAAQSRVNTVRLAEAQASRPRQSISVLFTLVFFVLLIAAANVANLQLVRAAGRQREAAVRAALGASRSRLLRPAMIESLLLSLAGGTAGIWLGYGGLRLLIAWVPSYMLPANDFALDKNVLLYTLGICVVTSVLFGLAPALHLARADTNQALKEGGRGAGGHGARLGRVLVISEIAPALILLISAGLLLKGFNRLQNADPGFRAAGVVAGEVSLPDAKYNSPEKRSEFFRQLLARLQGTPGVESAGAVTRLGHGNSQQLEIAGQADDANAPQFAGKRSITPDYFRTMSIVLLRGRGFSKEDTAGAMPVAIVNQTLARRFWPDQDPLGRKLRLLAPAGSNRAPGEWLTVVGVVADDKQDLLSSTDPEMYLPQWQDASPVMSVVVRTSGPVSGAAAALRSAVAELDRDLPVSGVQSLEKMLADSVAPQHVTTMLLAIFGAVGLFLAGVGIYGVISYSVSRRTQELGVRMALGARPADVVRMVLREGLGLTAVGLAVGLLAAVGVTRVLSAFLFGVSATDATIFSAVPVVFAAVATLATLVPARRASRVDPLVALRQE